MKQSVRLKLQGNSTKSNVINFYHLFNTLVVRQVGGTVKLLLVSIKYIIYLTFNKLLNFNVSLNSLNLINFNLNKIQYYVYKFFKGVLVGNYVKIKFKGKGYRLYKSYSQRCTIGYVFGHSHLLTYNLITANVKILTKVKLIIMSLSLINVNMLALYLINRRFINIFTVRGIRLARQVINKKNGKISTYR